ncbi:het domain protein [Colletotrichum chrysophilum]|uniref:Het domain protein n=1 Tax=Colletotrichum chrysophilum TaxID=1836956 RepID=A0AAD9AWF1_9PEZI|nr:het domain protein [Colletotrichum chrysophilum]
MWLIDTSDLESLHLVEFLGDPPDSYAILSHTWGSDEITFEQFNDLKSSTNRAEDGSPSSLSGYQKVKGAASLAKRQEFTYLWVHTCCINKASSAELSESINSMYHWYKNATVCFAYLSDVSPGVTHDLSGIGSEFRGSRWFTRGWTLQELIAPRVVEFYASDWSHIDTKKIMQATNIPFCGILSEITGIDIDVLAGRTALDDTSIADKMRWAAKRKTKRREDMAYCLLGLFDVNMPLLYGEGSKAFIRLQEEILKDTNDQSIFLWAIESDTALEMDTLHGLLANSPEEFSRLELNHVRAMPPLESNESVPASITSQGLRTSILLIPITGDDHYAVLDCTVSTSHTPFENQAPCIFLRRLWGDQFARIPWSVSYGVQLVPSNLEGFQREGTITTIYVKQTPFYIVPGIAIRTYIQTDQANALSSSFSIIEAYPAERFSTTQSTVLTGEPQSGRTIVILRFGNKDKQLHKPLADVAVGLLRVGRRWEVQYEKHPYIGTELKDVYQNNSHIRVDSKAECNSPGEEGLLTIYTTEQKQRGRRFVHLEVFCTPQLSPRAVTLTNGVGYAIASTEADFPKTSFVKDIANLVSSTTRQCCYQDTFSRILSSDSPFTEGVRTRPVERGRDFASCLTSDVISQGKPYADMVRAIHEKDLSKIKSLASRNKALIECQTEEFDDFRPLHWVAAQWTSGDELRAIKKLVNLKVDIRSRTRSGWMAIHLAILTENFPIVLYLLEKSRRSRGEWNLTTTAGETLSHLLAAYAQDFFSWGDVDWMSNNSKGKVIDALIVKSIAEARVNSRGELPIHRAVANGNTSALAIGKLFEASSINAKDNAGRTVLFHAVCGGNNEIIRKLIGMGASPEIPDSQGRTLAHAAVMARQPGVLGMLLGLGADPNATTAAIGLTPLHFACLYGFLDCVTALLDAGKPAVLNSWSTDGASFQPVHLAVANRQADCIQKLIKAGCSIDGSCNSYLKLKEPQGDRLDEAEIAFLPKPMSLLELAMFLGNIEIASLVSELSREIAHPWPLN